MNNLNISDEELIKKWLEEHDGDDYCLYCIFSDECSKGVTPDGSGEPIYPPCTDGDYKEELLDEESLLEVIKEADYGN